MDDASLSRLDFVIASVHSAFRLDEKAQTERICRAIANPLVDILGHPTGRILQGRPGYAVNLDEVLKTALRHKKCIEINASPHRLDLDWTHVKQAVDMGIPLAINPDAHRTSEFDYVQFGMGMARKGWAAAGNILNTKPWDEISRRKKGKRDHGAARENPATKRIGEILKRLKNAYPDAKCSLNYTNALELLWPLFFPRNAPMNA